MRLCREDDFDAVASLTLEAYRRLPGIVLDDGYAAELCDVKGRSAEDDLLVAEEGGEVIGAVTLVGGPASAYAEGLVEGEAGIRMLAVAPARWGHGAGRALVTECVSRSVTRGMKRVVLHTLPVMVAAHRLYEGEGFAREPGRDFAPAPGIELLCYQLELG